MAVAWSAIDLFEVSREKHGTHNVISVRIAKLGGKKVKAKAGREPRDGLPDP